MTSPKIRRRRLPALAAEMILENPNLRYHLEAGTSIIDFSGFKTRERFAEAWELTRETIMCDYVAKHPGRRPFAWWLCDHKQERPIIPQMLGGEPLTRERLLSWDSRHKEYFGFVHTRTYPAFQEYEEDYLERLGLLEPWEIQRLREMEAEDLKRLESDPHAGIQSRRVYTARTDYESFDE